jgi:hypothetical protein
MVKAKLLTTLLFTHYVEETIYGHYKTSTEREVMYPCIENNFLGEHRRSKPLPVSMY